jgi:hypothetical protein
MWPLNDEGKGQALTKCAWNTATLGNLCWTLSNRKGQRLARQSARIADIKEQNIVFVNHCHLISFLREYGPLLSWALRAFHTFRKKSVAIGIYPMATDQTR